MSKDFHSLPPDLPVPEDDGAADHLPGEAVPDLVLASSDGAPVGLAAPAAGLLVLYIYPRTGRPGEPSPDGWDAIPGARGCTPQSCAFRDHAQDLAAHGAAVMGLSAQTVEEQVEFARREHMPFPLLADPDLLLADAMRLPTFSAGGMRLYKRLTLVAEKGRVAKAFYPVFPPDRNAADVLAWLAARPS